MSRKRKQKDNQPPRQKQGVDPARRKAPIPLHFWIRCAAAVALVFVVIGCVRFGWHAFQADMTSTRGFRDSQRETRELVALAQMREALREMPWDPITQFRVASTVLQLQSQRLASQGYERVDVEELNEAVELFKSAKEARHKPQIVDLRVAQINVLLAEIFRQRQQNALMREASKTAASHYALYRFVQGKPEYEPLGYYRRAIDHSLTEPWPQLALTQYEDFHYYFPERAVEDNRILDLTKRARLLLGEFHLMFFDLALQLSREPGNSEYLRQMQAYAQRFGLEREALFALEELAE